MILVTAATGMFGSAIVRSLSGAGAPVRATGRSLESLKPLEGPLVDVMASDMDDPDSLDAVLVGVDRVLVNAPMDAQKEKRERNVIDAMVRSGTNPQIVLLTGGVQHDDALGLAGLAVEDVMRKSGLPWTIVGPQTVMESNFPAWRPVIQKSNALVACCGDAKIGFVALADVADAFTAVLTQGVETHTCREYIITGPASVTWGEVAESASRALGREIVYNDMSRADYRAMMISWGAFTEDTVDVGIMLHQDAFREGKAACVTGDFTKLTGRAGTTVEEWWVRNASHFLAPIKPGERY